MVEGVTKDEGPTNLKCRTRGIGLATGAGEKVFDLVKNGIKPSKVKFWG